VTDGAGREPAPASWWVAHGRRLIRALPAGRFRAAAPAARPAAAPFLARMSPDHAGARFCCGIGVVDLISIDVEGFEPGGLAGMTGGPHHMFWTSRAAPLYDHA